MDVLTVAGQKTVADERRAQEIFERHFPDYKYIHTPKNLPADIDAIAIYKGEISAVIETKCRYNLSIQQFRQNFDSKWLVTFDKIIKAKSVADSLCVPLVGFLYLKECDTLLMTTIYRNKMFLVNMTIENTRTQRTVNGGEIVRSNAYIDMNTAHILTAP